MTSIETATAANSERLAGVPSLTCFAAIDTTAGALPSSSLRTAAELAALKRIRAE
jgi:hypothetical protein